MKLASTAVIVASMSCMSSGCFSVTGSGATGQDQTLNDDAAATLLGDSSGADDTGPVDPAVLNPVRPVGASARPPRPIGDGESSDATDPDSGLENPDEEDAAIGTSEATWDAGGLGTGDTILTTSIVNAWTYPFFEAALMANELSLLADAMTIEALSPAAPGGTFTYLERLCIASGELEFICRQRYGH